jgi:hypothetical protein
MNADFVFDLSPIRVDLRASAVLHVHRSIQFMFAFAITWLAFVVGFTIIWWVASRSDDVLLQNLMVR